MKHTPTPWHVTECDNGVVWIDSEGDSGGNVATVWGVPDKNALATGAFIVLACNSHHELVRELSWCIAAFRNRAVNEDEMAVLHAAEKALAKAEGAA